jgi:tetratricopeptide (TPR) repeat protein
MAHAYGKLDMAIAYLREACTHPLAPAAYHSNMAEMCRQKGLLAEGEQAAQRAVTLDPNMAGAWNNLGIILQESGKLEASLSCLERLVELQPASAEAQNNLGNTCRRLDRLEQAEQHYRQALALNPNYAEAFSNIAFLFCSKGQLEDAAAAARKAIDINPRLADAYLNIGEVETSRVRHGEALRWIDALLSFASQHPSGLAARAQILKKLDRTEEALACVQQALAIAPENAGAYNTFGQVLQTLGKFDEALAAFAQAAALPGTVAEEALVARATLYVENGRKDEATAAFDHVLKVFPGSVRVITSRADSKKFNSDDPDIAAMEAALVRDNSLSQADRLAVHFSLGKAYLDTGNSARAFHHLDAGNRTKRATFDYDAAATSQWFKSIATTFTADYFARVQRTIAGVSAISELPVFIIGMPRSGTTLTEQILASHPQVLGAGELSAMRMAVDAAGAYPQAVPGWSAQTVAAIGRRYLTRIESLAMGRDRVVDKMPANFLYAGLMPLILPGARIIHCRRDPVDTCLSCYTKQFAGEQLFTYEQSELGRFHRDYQALMQHWRTIMPADRFIEVDYESVVDDLEGEAKRLISFIGLPWDAACLNFHETKRVVRTASVNQVRQPIYKTSKGRWQAHAEHLAPLLAALRVAE